MNFLKKIVHWLSNICYLLIIAYAIIELPMLFGYKPLVVLSGSMEPSYKVGSVLYYKSVEEKNLRVGDVITFELEDGTFVTHRINRIVNGEYETKGDANNTPDLFKVKYENVKGKVANINIIFVGYFIKFINTHLYLVGVVAIILLSEFLLSNVGVFDINRKERSN